MHLYSALLCIAVHPQRFTIMWGGGGGLSETMIPLHGNFELRPLGATMGERLQRDWCLKKHMKKHHPLAGDSPWRHYRRDHKDGRVNTSSAFSSSLTGLRALWAFSMRKLRSRLSLFSRKEGQPSASRDSVPTAAEARRRLKSRGSQLDMADELEKDRPFSRASAVNESELLDCDDAIFLTSSDSAVSALLGYAQEEQEMFEGEEVETEPSQSSCTAYEWVFGGYGS